MQEYIIHGFGVAYKNILISAEGPITLVVLNRPERLNAVDADMLDSLYILINDLAGKKACRAVIITGSGERSFCTGVDINYLKNLKDERDASAFVDRVHATFNGIEALEKPVIAAVNGYCLGGGCELAISCDMRIATPDSVFGQPEVKLGIMPGGGSTYRLPYLIGTGNAKEMILSGDAVSADVALRIGLINRVVDKASLIREAKSIALRMIQNSYNAVKNAKLSINANVKRNDKIERKYFLSCFNHPDKKEGIDAFLKHRKPEFK